MIDRDFISWFEKQKRPQSFEDFKKENQMICNKKVAHFLMNNYMKFGNNKN